jgi:vancomycin permeability regulator SanA
VENINIKFVSFTHYEPNIVQKCLGKIRFLICVLIFSFLLLFLYFVQGLGYGVKNTTFNNISDISLRSVLLVEETGVLGENHRSVASH